MKQLPLTLKTIPDDSTRDVPAGTRERPLDQKFAAKEAAWAERPAILENRHDVFLGDARTMSRMPDDTKVHLIVTSPPYWNLKKYASDRDGQQLGHIDDRANF